MKSSPNDQELIIISSDSNSDSISSAHEQKSLIVTESNDETSQPVQKCNLMCCLFGCFTCFGCRNHICRQLVFFPPAPPTYVLGKNDNNGKEVMYLYANGEAFQPYSHDNFKMHFLTTKYGYKIFTYFIQHKKAKYTFLYSHGNATDLGAMRSHFLELSSLLEINILAYDYSGYGLSEGLPSIENVYADIECSYQFLLNHYHIDPSTIILYGLSIGSGPTFHLASLISCAGIVVHGAIMSGLRVIQPVNKTNWFDIFPNIDLVGTIQIPILVIHGCDDMEIPVHHGYELWKASNKLIDPLFIEGAGHNNIYEHYSHIYLARLKSFLTEVDSFQNQLKTNIQN